MNVKIKSKFSLTQFLGIFLRTRRVLVYGRPENTEFSV